MGRRAVVGNGRAWRGSGEGGGDGGGEGGGKAEARKVVIGEGDGGGDRDGEMAEERAPPGTPLPPGLLQVCAARTSGPQEAEEPDAETRARRRGPRSYHVAAASPESRAQVVDPHFQLLGVVFVPGTPASNLNLSVLTVRTSRQHVIQFNSSIRITIMATQNTSPIPVKAFRGFELVLSTCVDRKP